MRFKTMWRNQNLHVASALGIQKETLGNHSFSVIIKLQLGKKCHTLLCILLFFKIILLLNYL